jgi:UDP-2-acetamido-3-amino-2,3-dideoxy-glucuronate N-acetyltransferase
MTIPPSIHPSSQISSSAVISADSVVGPLAIVEEDVVLEKNVVLGPGCFVGRGTVIHEGAVVCANAVLAGGIIVGERAQIRLGAVVIGSVPPHAIVEGNPAHIVGYEHTLQSPTPKTRVAGDGPFEVRSLSVDRVTLHQFPLIKDLRGDLSFGEFEKNIPFRPKRFFLVFGVPNSEIRGEHAHKNCHQFLICVKGSCSVVADDTMNREEVLLDQPNIGIYLPPMIWGIQYRYTPETVLLVFTSDYYDAADYIRDYREFVRARKEFTTWRAHST